MGFKSSYSRLARLFEKSRDEWRAKAIARRKENRLLELKIRDLEISRAKWKEKALTAADAQEPRTEKGAKAEKDENKEKETRTALAEISPFDPANRPSLSGIDHPDFDSNPSRRAGQPARDRKGFRAVLALSAKRDAGSARPLDGSELDATTWPVSVESADSPTRRLGLRPGSFFGKGGDEMPGHPRHCPRGVGPVQLQPEPQVDATPGAGSC